MTADNSENNKVLKSSAGRSPSTGVLKAEGGTHGQPSGLYYSDIASLSRQDQEITSAYLSLLPQAYRKSLVPLGIYRGTMPWNSLPWDVRLVFLDAERGHALLIMRVIKAEVGISDRIASSWDNLPELLKHSCLASGSGYCSISGQEQSIYWSLRRFCEFTLADNINSPLLETLKPAASTDCLNIISELSELETRLVPHGHITKANIGSLDNHLCLLDPWFSSVHGSNSASEDEKRTDEILSVRSFSSLFLNMFGSSLDQNLIVAFQECLTSEQQMTSFTELFKSINSDGQIRRTTNISNPEPGRSEDSTRASQSSETARSEESRNLSPGRKILSAGSGNFGQAPAGRIIFPRNMDTPVGGKTEQRGSSHNNDSSTIESKTRISLKSISGIQSGYPDLFTKVLSGRGLMFFCVALITAVLVMAGSKALRFSSSHIDTQKMQENWESNNPARLKTVAEAALEDEDSDAQEIIEMDILGGNNRPGVNPNFLKVAFNELWSKDLSSKDRIFAFSLSLAGLYRISSKKLPALDEVHPGVLLSLLGDMSLQGGEGRFDSIDVDRLSRLPGSYGGVFSGLKKLGIKSFADVSARAAARIITGASDQSTFDAFISPDSAPEDAEKRLDLIAPFCEMFPDLSKLIITSLASRSDYLAERVRWFVEDPIAQWNQVPENTLLYIVLGLIPEDMQSFDRIVDLLQYPTAGVRDQAKARLVNIIGNPLYSDLFSLLADKPSYLSRSQALGLLAATRVPAEKVAPFMASWLESSPNPKVVLQLLISTREQKSYESTFVQLANYLAKSDFEVSTKDLPLLITHPEPLARALVFPRLDASRIVDRRLLEAWLKSEDSPRLKEQIQIKLNSTQSDK